MSVAKVSQGQVQQAYRYQVDPKKKAKGSKKEGVTSTPVDTVELGAEKGKTSAPTMGGLFGMGMHGARHIRPSSNPGKKPRIENGKLALPYYPQDPGVSDRDIEKVDASKLTFQSGAFCGDADFSFQRGCIRPGVDGDFNPAKGSVEEADLNTFVTARRAKEVVDFATGRKVPWGFDRGHGQAPLEISNGVMWAENAFYSPRAGQISFGSYLTRPRVPYRGGELRSFAQDSDTVAHEVGHAILDGVRPLYSRQSVGMVRNGFHEGFGDMVSFFSAASDPKVVQMVKEETGGDLRKPNSLSSLSETYGKYVHGPNRVASRVMNNDFKDRPQEEMAFVETAGVSQKDRDRQGEFGSEVHAYGNLFSGSVYDIFVDVQESQGKTKEGKERTFEEKIAHTNKVVSEAVMRGVEYSPVGSPTTKDMALAMLRADRMENEGKLYGTMKETFLKREMISEKDLQTLDQELKRSKELSEKITMPKDLRSSGSKGAMKWLEENREALGIPKDTELMPFKLFQNDKGDSFLQFQEGKLFGTMGRTWKNLSIGLNGQAPWKNGIPISSSAPVNIYARGGLQIVFDKDGKLKDFQHDPITKEEVLDSARYQEALSWSRINPDRPLPKFGGEREIWEVSNSRAPLRPGVTLPSPTPGPDSIAEPTSEPTSHNSNAELRAPINFMQTTDGKQVRIGHFCRHRHNHNHAHNQLGR